MSLSLVAYENSDDEIEQETNIPTVQKKKEAVKILIPSLKEFEDEETPVAKKPRLQSGSGLFSLLPPPKNTTSFSKPGFMPHILSSKKEQTPSKAIQKCTDTKISTSSSVLESQESDDENSEKNKTSGESGHVSAHSDFFWLDDLVSNTESKGNESSVIPSERSNFFQNLSSQVSSTSNNVPKSVNYFQQAPETNTSETEKYFENLPSAEQSYPSGNYFGTESANEMDTGEALLKSKEFLKLQGRRHEFENIDIVDVSGDDQLTDKKQWLIKGLTEESAPRPSRKKHNMPTQQQKRKHQITYLAFQAKERENDLKNQWASNSRTRRETQAKYGF